MPVQHLEGILDLAEQAVRDTPPHRLRGATRHDQQQQLRRPDRRSPSEAGTSRSTASTRSKAANELPFSLKVLLENLLRNEDGHNVTADQVRALAGWKADAEPDTEIQFSPARVVMQDFTGVPCVVDLAAMREAMATLGGDPKKINPLVPTELVIDHSVIVDVFGAPDAFEKNAALEFERNQERYQFLRWGQNAFDGFEVVPPDTGIVHQVNLEYLARVVFDAQDGVRATRTRSSAPTRTPR